MSSVEETLGERETRYGRFSDGAYIWQQLQAVMQSTPGWAKMAPDQQYAATMLQMKLARALNGDPYDTDNWHDIQGYAKLVEDRILKRGIYAEPEQRVDDVQSAKHYPTCLECGGSIAGIPYHINGQPHHKLCAVLPDTRNPR